MQPLNITDALRDLALQRPDQAAVVYVQPGQAENCLTFRELDCLVDQYAAGLQRMGIGVGERVLILAQPDDHFVPFVLGLLRAGGVVVMVDPGRPLGEFLKCIEEAEPTALLAGPLVHALTRLIPRAFGKVTRRISTGSRFLGMVGIDQFGGEPHAPFPAQTEPGSEAAVIFTTGSTGAPKGVVYTHAILQSQCQALQTALCLSNAETGLFGASAMMLLGLISGVTVVLAQAFNTSPQRVDVPAFARLLEKYRITLSFCSPILCRRLAQYGAKHSLQLPHLRQLVIGGAPLDMGTSIGLQSMLSNGDVIISLGSTEAMPVAMISGQAAQEKNALSERETGGVCTGYPPAGHELRIIAIEDRPIAVWEDSLCLLPGQAGEIVIRGPVVTGAYLQHPEQTALSKIQDAQTVWHRMGDVGYLDEEGCLWFCGRKSQRVETGQGVLFTLPCEAVFNRHPAVARSALVGRVRRGKNALRGTQTPVIIIESQPGMGKRNPSEQKRLADELLQLAAKAPTTRQIQQVAFYPGIFPVDIRHNSKINREKLARWVARQHPLN